MKKKIIIIVSIILSITILSIIFNYLFVVKINQEDITLNINDKYDFKNIKGTIRGKKINLEINENVNLNELGDYEVTYKSHERIAINKEKVIKVHIIDKEGPVITLNNEETKIINYKEEYKEDGYKAIDNVDGDLTNKVEVTNNIDNTKLGKYKVTYKVKDSSNNETIIERNVEVKDTEAPVIKLNRNINSYLILNNNININDFKAIDNYDGDITDKVEVTGSVDNKKIGIYKVTYKVKDSSNNETILETTINVQKKNTKGIPVLMYHWFYDDTKNEDITSKPNNHNYISKTNFESQIKYLVDNNYYFPTWKELNDYIDKKIDLPEKSVILTDDDGVASFYEIAYPITLKYKAPITSFVITNKTKWKEYTNKDLLDMQSHTDSLHVRSCTKTKWDGAAMCKTYKEIKSDLQVTKDKLKNDPKIFAYPFGHYSDDFIKALKDTNFGLAFTINSGRVKKGANKYKLPRVRISRQTTLKQYANYIK